MLSYVLYVVEMARPITQSKIFIWMSIAELNPKLLNGDRYTYEIIESTFDRYYRRSL